MPPADSGPQYYIGTQDAATSRADYPAMEFIARMSRNLASTATLVKVVSVTNTPGQVAAVGQVNVQPLVNLIDGYGNATPHGMINGLAYFRYGGGPNAVLLDPEPGDIGLAVFADRDISSVKSSSLSTGQPANPGSRRRFDMADGIYVGLVLANAPTQYVAFQKSDSNRSIKVVDANGNSALFDQNGITLTDKNGNIVKMESSDVTITVPSGHRINCTAGGTPLPVVTTGGNSPVLYADGP